VRLVRAVVLPALAMLAFLGAWWLFEMVLGVARDVSLALAGMILTAVSIGQTVWAGHGGSPSPPRRAASSQTSPVLPAAGWYAPTTPPTIESGPAAPWAGYGDSPTPTGGDGAAGPARQAVPATGRSAPPAPPPPSIAGGWATAPAPARTPAPPRPWTGRRPSTVSAASGLLYSCAVLLLLSAGMSFSSAASVADVVSSADPADQSLRNTALVSLIVGACLVAVFAVSTGVLGVLVGKGSNPARIATWVLSSFMVLCYGCSLANMALSGPYGTSDPELQRRADAAVPAWQTTAGTGVSLVVLGATFAVIILLALPSSNLYFRRSNPA